MTEIAESNSTVGRIILLAAGDNGLNKQSQRLGLGQGGEYSLVENQRAGLVGEKGVAVGLLPAEVVEFFIMSHVCLFFV